MAKTKLQMQDISDVLAAAVEPFQVPSLVTAPFTQITDLSGNARKLLDPSKTVKLLSGTERVIIPNVVLIPGEKGPNGERVWGPENRDSRIRAVGNIITLSESYGTRGLRLETPADGFVEVSFYGTRLNVLTLSDGGARTFQAAVNGGSLTTYQSTTISGVLGGRNYRQNLILTTIPTQSEGLHTVKLQNSSGSLEIYGFEFINDSVQIKVPSGKIFNNGKGLTINSLQSFSYDTDFAIGTSNGRGGRVTVYSENNALKKAISSVNASAAYLSSANHTNEEPEPRLNFRKFGANRSDDFSTLGDTVSDRIFTLEDNTTTLIGNDVRVFTSGGTLINYPGVYINSSGANGGVEFEFLGSGLDFIVNFGNAAETITIYVDGTSVGTLPYENTVKNKLVKIASGLPYGTHKVRVERGGGFADFMNISDFIIYHPKKATIPENAVEIGEYYLMANFVANSVASRQTISTGVLRKKSAKEVVYVNGTGGTTDWNLAFGLDFGFLDIRAETDRLNAYWEYVFRGSGIEMRQIANSARSSNMTVSIQPITAGAGLLTFNTTNFNINGVGPTTYGTITTSVYGTGVTFNATTGQLDFNDAAASSGAGFSISGLNLGSYKIRVTNNVASSYVTVESLDIITPTYFPNNKLGSLSVGPGVAIKNELEKSNLDLSKAKAWVNFDGTTQTLESSFNISGVLRQSTGLYTVYFEKPFKNANYTVVALASTNNIVTNSRQANDWTTTTVNNAFALTDARILAVFFGELEDEE